MTAHVANRPRIRAGRTNDHVHETISLRMCPRLWFSFVMPICIYMPPFSHITTSPGRYCCDSRNLPSGNNNVAVSGPIFSSGRIAPLIQFLPLPVSRYRPRLGRSLATDVIFAICGALSPLSSSACRSASLLCRSTFDDCSVCPGLIGCEAINHIYKGEQLTSETADRSP